MTGPGFGRFESPQHAMYAGWVAGLAGKYRLPFSVVVDANGNYLPELVMTLEGVSIRLNVPPPPTGWNPGDPDA